MTKQKENNGRLRPNWLRDTINPNGLFSNSVIVKISLIY